MRDYVRVEQESMISNFNNADSFDPNFKGHEMKIAGPLAKNVTLETLYFNARKINVSGANPIRHKTRVQVKVKF